MVFQEDACRGLFILHVHEPDRHAGSLQFRTGSPDVPQGLTAEGTTQVPQEDGGCCLAMLWQSDLTNAAKRTPSLVSNP